MQGTNESLFLPTKVNDHIRTHVRCRDNNKTKSQTNKKVPPTVEL